MTQHELRIVCKCLLADLEGAIEIVGSECPVCWHQSIAEAREFLGIEDLNNDTTNNHSNE